MISAGDLLDGRYRLDALIGRGGTAEVYRATDELLSRPVAVKVFDSRLTDLNSVERQQSEMRVLASLNHPNLVAVHDARIADDTAESGGHTYLVMELITGVTLADLLARGPLPAGQARDIGWTLASALAFVHAHDLVHRDVKPANVLLSDSGGTKLGDFGLARLLTAEDRVTTSGGVMGTAAYFSPEQAAAREVGPAADIYSLGLVLLECLTGRREFPGEAVPAAVARLLRDPVIPTDLPAPWPSLLTAMTDSVPSARPTAAQVVEVLGAVPSNGSVTIPASASAPAEPTGGSATNAWSSPLTPFLTPAAAPVRRTRRRGPLLIGAGGLVAVLAVVGGLMLAQPGATPAPSGAPSPPVISLPSSLPSSGRAADQVRVGTSTPPPAPSTAPSSSAAAPTSTRGSSRSTSIAPVIAVTSRRASSPAVSAPTTAVATTPVPTVAPPTPSADTHGKSNGPGNGKGQTKQPKKPKG